MPVHQDPKAIPFEEIAEQYTSMIHQIIRRLHLYKDIETSMQLGLVGLWEATLRFEDGKGSFLNFAYMTVRGKILQHLRHEVRFYDHHGFSDDHIFLTLAAIDTSKAFLLDMLDELTTPLNTNEKQWLIKTIIEQKKPSEIVTDLGDHVERVKYWRKQVISKLRKQEMTAIY